MDHPNPAGWEAAYLAFETPEEETEKFLRRLRAVGVEAWSRESRILELFAGRGSGLHAWRRLGFSSVHGLDLSVALARRHQGEARYVVADARRLPLRAATRDVVCIQGGLHHLRGRDDLATVLGEARRALCPGGRLVVVEPWLDPFLRFVHWTSARRLARRLSPRIDALAAMIELEGEVYTDWLKAPGEILAAMERYFEPEVRRVRWGKLTFLGRPRAASAPD